MCAIVDNNVRHEVFSDTTPAGKKFREWIESGRGRLVVGGKLKRELSEYGHFRVWLDEFWRSGAVEFSDDVVVDERDTALRNDAALHFESNDQHVIALAQVSNARLLYSNDRNLQQDFGNRHLVGFAGKIYSTLRGGTFTSSHKKLLERNRCRQNR